MLLAVMEACYSKTRNEAENVNPQDRIIEVVMASR